MAKGQFPDCSRGFTPAAARQYIQRLNSIGESLQQATETIKRVKAQRDEANRYVMELRVANEAFSKRNGELVQENLRLNKRLTNPVFKLLNEGIL